MASSKETPEQCHFFFKLKEDEKFNRPSTISQAYGAGKINLNEKENPHHETNRHFRLGNCSPKIP